jgi:hypothetical protein
MDGILPRLGLPMPERWLQCLGLGSLKNVAPKYSSHTVYVTYPDGIDCLGYSMDTETELAKLRPTKTN